MRRLLFLLPLVLLFIGCKENPEGPARALGVALAGGCVLFALNYGVFLLKIKMGDAFNTALTFLIVGALITGSIYLLRKKGSG